MNEFTIMAEVFELRVYKATDSRKAVWAVYWIIMEVIGTKERLSAEAKCKRK